MCSVICSTWYCLLFHGLALFCILLQGIVLQHVFGVSFVHCTRELSLFSPSCIDHAVVIWRENCDKVILDYLKINKLASLEATLV